MIAEPSSRDDKAVLIARIVETGFVLPFEPSGPDRTSDGTFRLLRLRDFEHQLQYFEIDVASSTGAHRLFVLSASHLSDEDLTAIAPVLWPHFMRAPLIVVREDREGWARVSCADPTLDEVAAAAVGLVKASAGWDESTPIVIEIGARVRRAMEFRDTQWLAQIRSTR